MAYRKTAFVEKKRQETRARITAAAAALVSAGGWRACVLTAVARDAGVSTGSIYTHFARVLDLYVEVYGLIAEAELAVIAEIAERPGPAAARLSRAVEVFARRALRGRVQAYAVIEEPVAPELEIVRQGYRRRFVSQFERIIRDGVTQGALPPQNAETAGACVLGALSEALIAPLADPSQAPAAAPRLPEEVVDFCLRAVGATKP